MTSWQEQDVLVDGVKLHYRRTGGDKPPVVLLHGFTDDGGDWLRTARVLEADYDVIMPDARGHGLSDRPPAGFSRDHHVADAAGVITALGLDKPAVLGHSMGAGTTMGLARQHPDLVRCVLLEDPALLEKDGLANLTDWENWLRSVQKMPWEQFLAQQLKDMPNVPPEEVEAATRSKTLVDADLFHMPMASVRADWREKMAQITTPGLLIYADKERGGIVTHQAAEEAARLWKNLEVVHIPNAGHIVRRDQFDRYIEVVQGYLKRFM